MEERVEIAESVIPKISDDQLYTLTRGEWIYADKLVPEMGNYWAIVERISDGKGMNPKKGTKWVETCEVYRNDLAAGWQIGDEWVNVLCWMPKIQPPLNIRLQYETCC